ncbi:Transcription factor [Coemansia aciculifera]|nr:Transcription factor [Coemansia aciculifera]
METRRHKPLDLAREPNPFEHSFSLVQSEDIAAPKALDDTKVYSRTSNSPKTSPSHPSVTPIGRSPLGSILSSRNSTPFSRAAASPSGDKGNQLTPSIKLPPVTAISGPVDPAHMPMVWGAESLRSGPLSPAMLGGPTATSGTPKPLGASTPGASRLGLTDPSLHTGLTPYIAGEAQPTRAFGPIRMPQALVTPYLEAAMHATVNGQDVMSTPGGTLRVAPPRQQLSDTRRLSPNVTTPLAASQSELRSMPRPYGPEPMAPAFPSPRLPPPRAKRARQDSVEDVSNPTIITKRKNTRKTHDNSHPSTQVSRDSSIAPTFLFAPDSDVETNDLDPYATHGPDGQPLTEEEKRKQFLERNRIAALKCRQRKKKQLQELQDRHDYMVHENERLRKEYMEMREIALQARAMLAAHADCPIAMANGVHGVDSLPPGLSTSLHSLVPPNTAEAEYAKKIIAAIPPTSNGIPVHSMVMPAMPERVGRRSVSHSQRNMMPESHYEHSPRMWRD